MVHVTKKLTKKDCAKGFHYYEREDEDTVWLYDRCQTCGKVEKFPAIAKENPESLKRWQEAHKLDMLQPYGKMKRDFYYYYGALKE